MLPCTKRNSRVATAWWLLSLSTGRGAETNVKAITVDSTGSAYVAGAAVSDGTFPITSTKICDPGVYGSGCSYTFVTKFDPTGASLLYSTVLGPNNNAPLRKRLRWTELLVDDEFQCLARTSHNFVSRIGIKKPGLAVLVGGERRSCASQKFLAPLPVGKFSQWGGSSTLVIEKIEPLSDQK